MEIVSVFLATDEQQQVLPHLSVFDLPINLPEPADCLRLIHIDDLHFSLLAHKHKPLLVHGQNVRQVAGRVGALVLSCLSYPVEHLATTLFALPWLAHDDAVGGGAGSDSELPTEVSQPLELVGIDVEVLCSQRLDFLPQDDFEGAIEGYDGDAVLGLVEAANIVQNGDLFAGAFHDAAQVVQLVDLQ